MLDMIQSMAYICFLGTDIRLSSCPAVRWDAMMTERVSCPPRLAYLRCLGKAFNAREGGDSIGGVKFVAPDLVKSGLMPNLQYNRQSGSMLKSSDLNSN